MNTKKRDLTAIQIRKQLEAFDIPKFEFQALPPKDSDLKVYRQRIGTAKDIMSSLSVLKSLNQRGYDISIRPMPLEASENAYPFAFIDDITEATAKKMEADGFQFAVLIESSPGNFHGWVRVHNQPIPKQVLTVAAKMLAERYGGDKASADWRHYGRLAGFTNRKWKHRQSNGMHPFVMLKKTSKAVAEAGPGLVAEAELKLLEISSKPRPKPTAAAAAFSVRPQATTTGDPNQDFVRFFNGAKQEDLSARDFVAALKCVAKGYSRAQIIDAIMKSSPDLDSRHRNPFDYAERTADSAKAASMVNRGMSDEELMAYFAQHQLPELKAAKYIEKARRFAP